MKIEVCENCTPMRFGFDRTAACYEDDKVSELWFWLGPWLIIITSRLFRFLKADSYMIVYK